MEKTHQLIDNIYAAALSPSKWPSVVQSMQGLFNAIAAGIYTLDTAEISINLLGSQGIDEGYINLYSNYFLENNPWLDVSKLQILGKIRTEQSLDKHYQRPGFYQTTEYFNEWLAPQDFYYSLGTNLLSHGGIYTKFYMYRPKLGRPFSKLDITKFKHLSGHMIRSMEMTHRLALKDSQINDALHFIDRLQFGVFFLDERSTVIHANHFAQILMRTGDGLISKAGAIHAAHRTDGGELSDIIQSTLKIHRGQSEALPCTLSIRRPSGKRPFHVTAIPLPHQANSLSVSAAVILFISDPEQEPVVAIDYLKHRYRFTVTEARLVQYLSRGDALREAAEHTGLSYETARWYLKIIFQKTGTRRQAELLHLLLSDQVFVAHQPPAQE